MKQLKYHKVTNPKTIEMLREASKDHSYKSAKALVKEIYMDTGFKMSGKHMVIGAGDLNTDFLYIIEDIQSLEELFAKADQLPPDIRDILEASIAQEVIRYDDANEVKKEFEKDVNELIVIFARHCQEKRIDSEDGLTIILATYGAIVAMLARSANKTEGAAILEDQLKRLAETVDEITKALSGLKKAR